MSCPPSEKIAPTRASWLLVIATASAIMPLQRAMGENDFNQPVAFPPQLANFSYLPAAQPYAATPWPVIYSYAQGPFQPTSAVYSPTPRPYMATQPYVTPQPYVTSQPYAAPQSYMAPKAYAFPSWQANYAYAQAVPQPTGAWRRPAPGSSGASSWPADDIHVQQSAHPTSLWNLSASQSQSPLPWPANFAYAQQRTQPINQLYSPSPQTPQIWAANYNYLQPGASDDTLGATSDESSIEDLLSEGSLAIDGPFISTQTFCYWNDDLDIDGRAEFPVLGRMNVSEHNSPMPRDRAYFIYKHYNGVLDNSISDQSGNLLGQSTRGVDQYLFGFERTFHEGCSSLEFRMPFISTGSSQFNAGFASNDPSVGNFALIAKRILYRDDLSTLAAGCAATMPTGDDTVFSVGGQTFSYLNDTAHIIPFVGMLKQSADQRWFVIGFGGLDIPARGNQIQFLDPVDGSQSLGRLEDQTLLYLDCMVGRWFYRNPCADVVTGFSVQGEFHYAGSLNDSDSLQGVVSGVAWNTGYAFKNPQNRFDSTFAALVLHTELHNQTDIRITGIVPLNTADNRFFDSELIVSLTQRF